METINCILCGSNQFITLQKPSPYGMVKCRRCGLVFLNPRPDRVEHKKFHKDSYFESYYAQTIDKFYTEQNELYKRIAQLNRQRLTLVKGYINNGKLLDVGAGQGMFIKTAHHQGFNVIGTDLMDEAHSYFKSIGLDYRIGYLEELKLQKESFDVVTMWHSLEHTFNPASTLQEAHRVIRKGGYLFIAVPSFNTGLSYLNLVFNRPFFSENSTEIHYFYFTEITLRGLVEASGFKVLRIQPDIRINLKSSCRSTLGAMLDGLGKITWFLCGDRHNESIICLAQKF
ncbi:MAG: class I SAM-dependent methyltransferase [Candidatus Brocadiia bacterium]